MVVRIVVSADIQKFCRSSLNFDLHLIGINEVSPKHQKSKNSVCSKLLIGLNKILEAWSTQNEDAKIFDCFNLQKVTSK